MLNIVDIFFGASSVDITVITGVYMPIYVECNIM